MGQKLFISETADGLNPAPQGWLWIKPTESGLEIYVQDGGAWTLQASVSLADHSHPTLGDINFTGTIKVGGVDGLTGSRLIPGVGTLAFTKGILTGFTPV